MKKVIDLFIVVLVGLSFTGCTELLKDMEEPKSETALNDGTEIMVHKDEGPSEGGVLNLFMLQPDTLNPLATQNPTVRHLSFFVFDSLFNEKEDGTLENCLAESYTFSQADLVLDIKLRDDVLFHDGEPLTSDDVTFTVKAIKDAGQRSLYANNVANIQSIKAVSRLEFRIILEKSDDRLPYRLTFPIVPQHVFKDWPAEGHSDSMNLTGTGPFKFESFEDDVIKLIRNDSWWYRDIDEGLGHPVWMYGINFRIYLNESDMMDAFQKHEIDIGYLEEGNLEVYERRSDIFLEYYESNILEFLVFSDKDGQSSPISQPDFRNILIRYLEWYVNLHPAAKGSPVSDSADSGSSYEILDHDKALNALNGAGFTYDKDKNILYRNKNGIQSPVSLNLIYNGLNEEREDIGEWITMALFEIGITVDCEPVSYSEVQAIAGEKNFDMMLLGCRMPLSMNMDETLDLASKSLGIKDKEARVLPLYRKYGAVLYHNYIRGTRRPVWENVYNGWTEWYLLKGPEDGKRD